MPKRQRVSTGGTKDAGGGQEPSAPETAFEEQEMVIKMSLLPSAMDDLAKNVQSRLTSMLMRYQEDAGGVLLGLSNPRLPASHPHAAILDDLPFLHIHVTATALVFRPVPRLKLRGEIIKVAGTHIALLVYGLFNAAISEEDMGDGFTFQAAHGRWRDEESEKEYQVGDTMHFTVKRVHEAGGLISIDGSVRPPDAPPRAVKSHGSMALIGLGGASASQLNSPNKPAAEAGKARKHKPPQPQEEDMMEVEENGAEEEQQPPPLPPPPPQQQQQQQQPKRPTQGGEAAKKKKKRKVKGASGWAKE